MLTTNMIRKDLNSQNQYDAGVALSGLSCFISPDLSRDLANDIMTLVSINKQFYLMKIKIYLEYNVIRLGFLDEFNKTVSAHESRPYDVQSVSTISRCLKASFSQTQREIRRSRSGYCLLFISTFNFILIIN